VWERNEGTADNASRNEIHPLFALVKIALPLRKHQLYPIKSGLEIARCQWLNAGHILEMAGKNKFELPK
jgi:hypothetical protein